MTQLELGYTLFSDDDDGRTYTHTYPELLVRQGIFRDWFELRIGYTAISEETPIDSVTGSADLYVGAKIGLTPQSQWRPEMSLIPQLFVPSGSSEFSSDSVLPGLNWIYAWEVTDRLGFGGSTQFNRLVDGETSALYTQWAQSLVSGVSLTEDLAAYAEWFAFFPDDAETDPVEHYLNSGFARRFGNNVQWDIRAGVGLNDASQDFFVGTGLSLRFL